MIDTLMVVWTSGLWKQLLRSTCTFLLLFGCIGILSFLITTSSGKWSGLAISVAQSGSSTHANVPAQVKISTSTHSSVGLTTVQPAPAPTARPGATPYIVPIILQNPVLPDSTDSQNTRKHHHHIPTYTLPEPAAPPASSPVPGTDDPANSLQNLP